MLTRTQIHYNNEWMTLSEAKTKVENNLGKLIDKVPQLNSKQRLAMLEVLESNKLLIINLLSDLDSIDQTIKQD